MQILQDKGYWKLLGSKSDDAIRLKLVSYQNKTIPTIYEHKLTKQNMPTEIQQQFYNINNIWQSLKNPKYYTVSPQKGQITLINQMLVLKSGKIRKQATLTLHKHHLQTSQLLFVIQSMSSQIDKLNHNNQLLSERISNINTFYDKEINELKKDRERDQKKLKILIYKDINDTIKDVKRLRSGYHEDKQELQKDIDSIRKEVDRINKEVDNMNKQMKQSKNYLLLNTNNSNNTSIPKQLDQKLREINEQIGQIKSQMRKQHSLCIRHSGMIDKKCEELYLQLGAFKKKLDVPLLKNTQVPSQKRHSLTKSEHELSPKLQEQSPKLASSNSLKQQIPKKSSQQQSQAVPFETKNKETSVHRINGNQYTCRNITGQSIIFGKTELPPQHTTRFYVDLINYKENGEFSLGLIDSRYVQMPREEILELPNYVLYNVINGVIIEGQNKFPIYKANWKNGDRLLMEVKPSQKIIRWSHQNKVIAQHVTDLLKDETIRWKLCLVCAQNQISFQCIPPIHA